MLIWSKKATGRSIIRFAGRPEQLYASQRQCTADSRISGPVDEIYRAEYCNLPASRTTTIVYGEIMFNRQLISIALFIFLISVHGAFGASISITPSGNGNFIIQGNSMDGVSGIDLSIVYDKSSLASPSVSQGSLLSGAMMAANTNNPGAIRIVIISSKAFSGSGQVATISFATYAGNGSISVASTMINSKGAPVSGGGTVVAADFQTSSGSSGFYSTPGIPFSPPNSGDTTTTTTTTSTPSSSGVTTPRALGTVSMPGDAKPGGDAKPADAGVVSERVTNPEAAKSGEPHPAEEKTVAEPQAPVKVTSTSYPGALENFRAYKGEKSPAVLIDLLKKDIAPAIRQDPAFVLSRAIRHVVFFFLLLLLVQLRICRCSYIYVLFFEGYSAHAGDRQIDEELCRTAIRLNGLLLASRFATPEVTHCKHCSCCRPQGSHRASTPRAT